MSDGPDPLAASVEDSRLEGTVAAARADGQALAAFYMALRDGGCTASLARELTVVRGTPQTTVWMVEDDDV